MVAPGPDVSESNLMPRRQWFWFALFSGACGRPPAVPDVFPPMAAGVWRRTALEHPSVSDAPDPVPRSAVQQFERATYEGPGKLDARLYMLDSPAVAVELAQRWRPSADTVFFYTGRFFVVVKWEDADRKALQAFVAEVQKRLGKPKENA
jgi:hypothetical protein